MGQCSLYKANVFCCGKVLNIILMKYIVFWQTQNRAAYYPTSQLAQLRPSPRWTAQGARPHRKLLHFFKALEFDAFQFI